MRLFLIALILAAPGDGIGPTASRRTACRRAEDVGVASRGIANNGSPPRRNAAHRKNPGRGSADPNALIRYSKASPPRYRRKGR